MSRFIRSGSTLNIFPEGSGGPYVSGGTNDMHFNGDIQGSATGSSISGESWGPSTDDATIFTHEAGHTASGFNLTDPLNVAYSENLYRSWIGSPSRNDYAILSQGEKSDPVPNRSFWNSFLYQN